MKVRKTRLALALTAAVAVGGGLVGCDGGLTTPDSSPIIKNPTSDVTGKVLDAVTGEPIVGARVIIEGLDISATTNSEGSYILKNVPANTSLEGATTNSYRATIDLQGVTSPVKMSDTTITNRYAAMDSTGNTFDVRASDATAANGSIGETNIHNVTDFTVGKASAHIHGHVYDVDGTTKLAGVTLILKQGTEHIETIVTKADDAATTTVDESLFEFEHLEAGFNYTIEAMTSGKDKSKTFNTSARTNKTGTVLNESETLDVDVNGKIVLALNDTIAPSVVKSPDTGKDYAHDADVVLTWTFSEPIAADSAGYRDSTAVGGNLYNDITVTYNGAKAGEVAKTVAWNTDYTALSVTIAAASTMETSSYSVSMTNVSNTAGTGSAKQLKDAANNAVANANFNATTIAFTTNGGTDLAAVKPVVTRVSPTATATNITHNLASVVLDWPAVAGASSYYVYRQATVGGVDQGTVRIATVTTSNHTDTLGTTGDYFGSASGKLISSTMKGVSYTYKVAAVNANKVEGAMSDATTAVADNVKPTVTGAVCTANGGVYGGGEVTISFSEPVQLAHLETSGNFAGMPTGAKAIEANAAQTSTTIYYDVAVTCGTPTTVTVTGVSDIAGNAITTTNTATF